MRVVKTFIEAIVKGAAYVTLIYAILIFIGGVFGHLKAASTTSFITAIIASALLILTAIGMFKDHLLPCYFGILVIFALDAFFTYRWLLTMKFIPGGLMSMISLAALIAVVLLVRKHLRMQRKKR